ncbi:L-aspartate oxidase [Candidatus Roizmanbacteria bacterium CG22_combo_CG10-13_8_21_14_all_35_9]|uniref:L-aspartate oxidase n=3 Tax=Candidatus Roizmaniibacteriota TaxID=1752723 RepID=A0A2H0BZV9_9BACT|nr:MAG: L-aspartate oxidase [Candidatus Roizmanbacteria bacterium CG23_combo_of_CG06-09_8_20_14_all_35_49]PIP62580.1 MAG: L-aspartate oxidase [Candidatus Roizmanbacteria bacterium CG22_combo_CG10-13_8_21_14_all_35_9]PIY71083.1 MAG: L-aspartate oxidase [Candidatus Roizmanbacteria bacterium CG_4_10_14_0_8_um_filter_35_28]
MKSDVLIIGSGLAGVTAALILAEKNLSVSLITRSSDIEETNTRDAQGGIIYHGAGDPRLLEKDIIKAGAGINNKTAVKILAEEGPKAVKDILIRNLKINFTKDKKNNFHLTQEAGHSTRRILHVNDQTGLAIEKTFVKKLKTYSNIKVFTNHSLIDLLTLPYHLKNSLSYRKKTNCVGAYVLDNQHKKVEIFLAKKIVLATGGIGQIYMRTCNAKVSRADGLVAAYRAGAKLANVEYIQFHPTSFYHHSLSNFLITEALRGEGAKLKNQKGELFMKKYDKRGSLAPRDIVSQGIFQQMLDNNEDYVLLDACSYISSQKIKKMFPHIYQTCKKYGVDITREPIPVAPTAHYFCGGVKVDTFGRTGIDNLYAVGEVSCTGVHGANRLASTSLLECLLWGKRAGENINKTIKKEKIIDEQLIKSWRYTHKISKIDPALIQQDWFLIKSIMWNYVGIIRTEKRLQRAVDDLAHLDREIDFFYRDVFISDELIGLRNGVKAALIIAQAALKNKKSLGCHFRKEII